MTKKTKKYVHCPQCGTVQNPDMEHRLLTLEAEMAEVSLMLNNLQPAGRLRKIERELGIYSPDVIPWNAPETWPTPQGPKPAVTLKEQTAALASRMDKAEAKLQVYYLRPDIERHGNYHPERPILSRIWRFICGR